MSQGYDELLSIINTQADAIESQSKEIRRLSNLVALLENDREKGGGDYGKTETTGRGDTS